MHLVLAGHGPDLDRGNQFGSEFQGLEIATVARMAPVIPAGNPM